MCSPRHIQYRVIVYNEISQNATDPAKKKSLSMEEKRLAKLKR